MEAIRQLRWQLGRNAVCVHLTYVPYLKAADELKTKPTQHSVKELQGMGIQPDILVLRTERHLDDHLRMKVASFCNVDLECVVQSEDMASIYEVPVSMQKQGLDAAILRKTGIPVGETPAMKPWHDFLDKQRKATREVHIALVGKYDLQDAYKSIRESLNLAGIYNDVKTKIHFINSEELTAGNVATLLDGMAGVLICPGFGQRGIEGKIIAAEYGRTHDIPTFGICLGMQMMVIEFARNVLGYEDANSSEMSADTKHPVIDLMEEQKTVTNMGGTMRLGAYDCEPHGRQPGVRGIRQGDADQRKAPAPLRVQQPVSRGIRGGRHEVCGHEPCSPSGGDRRDTRQTLVHRHPVPPRILIDGVAPPSAVYGLCESMYKIDPSPRRTIWSN